MSELLKVAIRMNIVLIGYRGTGKTTISKLLGNKLKRDVINLDERIVEKAGLSIPKIVERFGWDRFRDIESEIVEEVSIKDNCVIDTGGGVVLRDKNIRNLKKNGIIILLTASKEKIVERIKNSNNRPSLTKGKTFLEEIELVMEERKPKYTLAQDYTIDTSNLTTHEIFEQILSILNQKLR